MESWTTVKPMATAPVTHRTKTPMPRLNRCAVHYYSWLRISNPLHLCKIFLQALLVKFIIVSVLNMRGLKLFDQIQLLQRILSSNSVPPADPGRFNERGPARCRLRVLR